LISSDIIKVTKHSFNVVVCFTVLNNGSVPRVVCVPSTEKVYIRKFVRGAKQTG